MLIVKHHDAYLDDFFWYVEHSKAIESSLALEHMRKNPPVQLKGDLSNQPFRV